MNTRERHQLELEAKHTLAVKDLMEELNKGVEQGKVSDNIKKKLII